MAKKKIPQDIPKGQMSFDFDSQNAQPQKGLGSKVANAVGNAGTLAWGAESIKNIASGAARSAKAGYDKARSLTSKALNSQRAQKAVTVAKGVATGAKGAIKSGVGKLASAASKVGPAVAKIGPTVAKLAPVAGGAVAAALIAKNTIKKNQEQKAREAEYAAKVNMSTAKRRAKKQMTDALTYKGGK